MSLQARGNSDPGQLDRRVQLLAPSTARDAAGGETITWSQFAEVWAAKLPVSGGRMYGAEQKHSEASITYRIRHRTDVVAFQRLQDGDAVFEIIQPEELGRAHFMELPCRALDQNTAVKRPVAADV